MRNKFIELAKAKIQDKRNIIISKVNDEDTSMELGFTVAQQIEIEEAEHKVNMFFKGAFHLEDEQGLINLRDACNCAIKKLEESKED